MRTAAAPRALWRPAAMLAVVLLCTAVPASLTSSVASDQACAHVVQGKVGVWTTRPAPTFPGGDRVLRGHTVDPRDPLRQYATNGVSVMRTTDGCTWSEAFRLPGRPSASMPASSLTDRVLQVVVHPRAPGRVWMVVAIGQDVAERVRVGPYRPSLPLSPAADEDRDGTQTLVVASRDGGSTWTSASGPPLPGAPGQLATAPTSPEVLYLPTFSGLHASLDGGRTWQPRPPAATVPDPQPGRPPLDAVAGPHTTRVTVDPTGAAGLYGHNATAVRRSEDGGLTWSAYRLPPDYTSGPFVDRTHSSTRRMVVATQASSTQPVQALWFLSPDDTFTETTVEPGALAGVPWRAAWHPMREELVMATWDRGNGAAFPEVSLYRVSPDGAVEDINELDLTPVKDLEVDDYGTYHLHTGSEMLTLATSTAGSADLEQGPPQVEMDPFGHTPPAPPEPAELSGPTAVDLVPGEPSELTWGLDLPARPSPLDTYFLIDTSNSFEPDIQALADGMGAVVRTLARAGIDAHFGVGELGTREARRYRRFSDIAPPGTRLQRGFERLRTGGGYESHLIALHQTATGSGVEGTSGPAVPAGQDPTWRDDSLRTLVVVTDVEYGDEDDPEAPARQQVYEALADRGIRVIGLEVVREGGDDDGTPGGYAAVEAADAASTTVPTPARRDLEELAAATGSFAPPGGVDCRDNGTTEIAAGDPMVCTTTALHVAGISTLADVLTRVLLQQVDERPVTLRPRGEVSVTPVAPTGLRHRSVDVKRDQQLTFSATLRCDRSQTGQRVPVTMDATLARRQVASMTTMVRCGPSAGDAPATPGPADGGRPVVEPLVAGPPASPTQVVPPIPGLPPAVPVPIAGSAPGAASGTVPGSASASAGSVAPGTSTGPAASVAPTHDEAPELAHAHPMTARPADLPHMGQWTVLAAGLLTGATAHRVHRARRRRAESTVRNWNR
ncbi:MAG: hypothetical protein Q8Q02_11310 [Nocardioides sp.]|nr:hypothetical protein [Nocardioides sp.]